jgi:hypothetical protein
MADIVNTGQVANDSTGDDLRSAFTQINQRFQELLGTLSQITWTPGLAIEATPARQWTVVAGQAYVAASNHIAGGAFESDLADGRWLAVDVAQLINSLASGVGASMVGYPPAGAGAVFAGNAQDAIDVVDKTFRLPALRGVQALKQDNGPLLVVATGQSNMLGSNNDTSGDNTTTSAKVFVWNWSLGATGEFVISAPETFPPYGNSYTKTNNLAHWFGLRLAEETGRDVYIVLRAQGSTSIVEWTPGFVTSDQFAFLSNEVSQALALTPALAGKTKADVCLWLQGEQDAGMVVSTYRSHFATVYARFTGAAWFDQQRPFICGELPLGTVYATQNALHSNHHRYGRMHVLTASSVNLDVDSSGVHYTGASLQELGYNRFANAYFEHLANLPSLNTGDIYKTYPIFFNPQDLGGEPVSAKTMEDFLCSTPHGIRSGAGPFTELEGKTGYRTLIGSALADGATVPTDMPGGLFRLNGNVTLPTVVAMGYTVTLLNISAGRVSVSRGGSGVIVNEQGNVTSMTLGPQERVTLVAFDASGGSWFIANNGRGSAAQATISDDAAISITPPNLGGQIAISVNPAASSPNIQTYGNAAFDVGSTPNVMKLNGGTLFSVLASDVTGTTGVDGQLTVGVIAGAVKVENRTGGAIVLRWQFLA